MISSYAPPSSGVAARSFRSRAFPVDDDDDDDDDSFPRPRDANARARPAGLPATFGANVVAAPKDPRGAIGARATAVDANVPPIR